MPRSTAEGEGATALADRAVTRAASGMDEAMKTRSRFAQSLDRWSSLVEARLPRGAGFVSVIAADGTVLEPYVAPRLVQLPLVVGSGAQARAKELLALLDHHPALRDFVHASVLVGERRWNLRLKNGIDVRLPETQVAA